MELCELRPVCMHVSTSVLYICTHYNGVIVINRFGVSLANEFEVIEFFNDNIDVWGMDMFHLNDITNGHPLIATACAIFRVSAVMSRYLDFGNYYIS